MMPVSLLTDPEAPILAVGDVRLDCGRRQLVGPCGSVDLKPSVFAALRMLFRRPGVVIDLDALIDAMWPEVDDWPEWPRAAARLRIGNARAALNQVGAPAKMLRTVFQQGYRLDGPAMTTLTITPAQAAAVRAFLAQAA